MCGFFGQLGPTPPLGEALAGRIARAIAHRGPDDEGFLEGAGWALGFRRLSILDLSAKGHQPITTEDGRYVLVFNGEIYNYRELKDAHLGTGARLRGASDTEVLLHLLAREGRNALPRLNGMFAFAFLDLERRTYLVARDRLGVKPLYLRKDGQRLRFASELKALLAFPDAPRSIDRDALLSYLSLGYVAGEPSILAGYRRLPAGCLVAGSLDAPTAEPERWWTRPSAPRESCGDELERLDALIEDAVRIRLRSDVPVAVLLSGGIDSGLVASYAAEAPDPPKALTVRMHDRDFDESKEAAETARRLGLELEVLEFGESQLGDLDRLTATFDEPFADTSALPTLKLCATARGHATVLLSGDGGDEAFGGYRRYVEAARYGWLERMPDRLLDTVWSMVGGLPLPPTLTYRLAKATLPDAGVAAAFDGPGLERDPALRAVLPADLSARAGDLSAPVAAAWAATRGSDILARQRGFDYALYLPDDVLVKVDRSSMAAATEVRSPLLDYRIVELAAAMPSSALVDGKHGKLPLRRLADRRLPRSVAGGRKRGFGAPVDAWFRTATGSTFLRERLLDRARPELWDRTGAEALLALHASGRRRVGDLLWRLAVLGAWADRWVYGPAAETRTPVIATA